MPRSARVVILAVLGALMLGSLPAAAAATGAGGRTERNTAATACPVTSSGVHFTAPGSGKTVALTFDDGPGRDTARIMSILAVDHVTATFFNLGANERLNPSTVRAEQRAGYPVGDHTWDHASLPGLDAAGQAGEIDREANEHQAITGTRPCLFRPPYGAFDATTLALAHQRHMQFWNWSVDPEDWKAAGSGAASWVDRIRSRAEAGASQEHPIILFHNQPAGNPATVAALPSVIGFYRARGYRFVDVLGHAGPPAVHGLSAHSGRAAGGQLIALSGSDLTGVTEVRFGSASGTALRIVSPTRLYVRTPRHGSGTVDVRLLSDHGTSAVAPGDRFTFVAPPAVTSVRATSGPTAGGTVVRVTGHNFVGVQGIGFGSRPGRALRVVSPTLLYVTTPAHPAGSVAVKVHTAYGTSPTVAAGAFRFVAPPTVRSVAPATVPTAGAQVTVTGTGFSTGTAVSVDGVAAPAGSVSATTLTATLPAHAAGSATLVVTTPYGRSGALTVTYADPSPPPSGN